MRCNNYSTTAATTALINSGDQEGTTERMVNETQNDESCYSCYEGKGELPGPFSVMSVESKT